MRKFRFVCRPALAAGLVIFCGLPVASAETPAGAQEPAEAQALRREIEQLRKDFEALRQQYGDRLSTLETRLTALEGGQTAAGVLPPQPSAAPAQPAPEVQTVEVPPGAAGAGGPSGALPVYGAAVAGSKIFNPDMAVIGNFLGTAGPNEVNPEPGLRLRETEVSMQATVDPYARADFFLSFGPEGAAIEEGYITFPTLPGGVLMKAGKMKAAFGKVNTLHPHVLPWTDVPLTMELLGGEEGLNDAGISVARLIPNPWIFLEATGQAFRGDSGDTLFKSSERRDLSCVGHLRGYQDITESSNLDFGFSYARGHNDSGVVEGVDVGRFITQLYAADMTFRWRPLARSIYHSFLGRSEIVWSRREQPGGRQRSMGYYVSADYQFARRWFVGARYDRSGRPEAASLVDAGQSAILTFWPSEFSQVRGQYRRTRYAVGPTANEFLLQVQFAIGAHGTHPF